MYFLDGVSRAKKFEKPDLHTNEENYANTRKSWHL